MKLSWSFVKLGIAVDLTFNIGLPFAGGYCGEGVFNSLLLVFFSLTLSFLAIGEPPSEVTLIESPEAALKVMLVDFVLVKCWGSLCIFISSYLPEKKWSLFIVACC